VVSLALCFRSRRFSGFTTEALAHIADNRTCMEMKQEMSTPQMIECTSIYGNTVIVPRTQLIFRPSVYAIIEHDGKLLVIRSRHGGKLYLPGGGIELGERIETALKRELREETGLEIEVQHCVHFQEQFFYYDPLDEACHSFLFYYICQPTTTELIHDTLVDDEDAEQPRWIATHHLHAHDFQHHGELILRLVPSCSSLEITALQDTHHIATSGAITSWDEHRQKRAVCRKKS
jgi:8-oxo-dGTP pyrophosphatase MutT (NUDIX family)